MDQLVYISVVGIIFNYAHLEGWGKPLVPGYVWLGLFNISLVLVLLHLYDLAILINFYLLSPTLLLLQGRRIIFIRELVQHLLYFLASFLDGTFIIFNS